MHAVRSLVAATVLASVTIAVVFFWRLFWSRIDPWLRRALGQRLGIEIEWRSQARERGERGERGERAWYARGSARRTTAVDALAIAARFAGIVAPVLVVGSAALALGVDAYFGRFLVLSTLFTSAVCGRNAPAA